MLLIKAALGWDQSLVGMLESEGPSSQSHRETLFRASPKPHLADLYEDSLLGVLSKRTTWILTAKG